MATTPPFASSNWKVAYQAALLEYRSDGLVGAKLEVAVTACITTLENLNQCERQERHTVSAALTEMLNLRRSYYNELHSRSGLQAQSAIVMHPWEQDCFAALRETNKSVRSLRVYEALAAIEKRRLTPADANEEIELTNAETGLRKLMSVTSR